jgi:hypothetical protein
MLALLQAFTSFFVAVSWAVVCVCVNEVRVVWMTEEYKKWGSHYISTQKGFHCG